MFLYAATIFVSAFLLFLVQPIMAKQILPWFGGAASVWTTCLVFFQATLLAGYAYSDLVVHRLRPRTQIIAHSVLLALSLAVLPIVPATHWKPTGVEDPSWLILLLLAATIGLPYFLLSTTSPLVQAWLARASPGSSPYRLFALSNLASMLALVGYPFLFEPWIPTRTQALGWSVGYVLFVLLCALAGWASLRRDRPAESSTAPRREPPASDAAGEEASPTIARQLLWATLAGTASLLLLAVSNHITQNIAAVPLLWIVPLSLYLLTFIICFDAPRWYRSDWILPMAAAALGVMAWTFADPKLTHNLGIQVGVFCVGLFIACMFCHGELARSKPAPRYLTRFYLMISLGGALGSAVVGILAPLLLPAYFELSFGLVLAGGLLAWQVRHEVFVMKGLASASILATIGCAAWGVIEFYDSTIMSTRNFYGVLRVQQYGEKDDNERRQLIHGTILHGNQYLAAVFRRQPTTYYTTNSGIGRVLESLNPSTRPLKVGVIGLGAGTLAAYGSKGDVFRFYDINPAVVDTAHRYFTYLGESDATIETVLGDARLSLEREPSQQFDVLAIDAFSSDAIPVHLITSEAMSVYLKHMRDGGVIAFHVTNRFLDLMPVVKALADAHGLRATWVRDEAEGALASRSDWVLLARDGSLLDLPRVAEAAIPIVAHPDWRLWTDDFNNLVQVLKRD